MCSQQCTSNTHNNKPHPSPFSPLIGARSKATCKPTEDVFSGDAPPNTLRFVRGSFEVQKLNMKCFEYMYNYCVFLIQIIIALKLYKTPLTCPVSSSTCSFNLYIIFFRHSQLWKQNIQCNWLTTGCFTIMQERNFKYDCHNW